MTTPSHRIEFVLVLKRSALLLWVAALIACGSVSGGRTGSETNWLSTCRENADCSTGATCLCGVCTTDCDADAACHASGALCATPGAPGFEAVCARGTLPASGLCLPGCAAARDCSHDQTCRGGVCVPNSPGGGGAGAGEPCDVGTDCASGRCEGQGCGPGEGRCVDLDNQVCLSNIQSYCGCDGVTLIGSSGSNGCAGGRYSYPLACDVPRPEGASCNVNGDCESGLCEGEGCGLGQGVCAPLSRPCASDITVLCGCEGTTFQGSSGCPGGRYAHAGPC